VECPTGSGNVMRLRDVAQEISRRLTSLFTPNKDGRRPCHGEELQYANDPHWNQLVLFYEYFHPDTGRGCGARYVDCSFCPLCGAESFGHHIQRALRFMRGHVTY